MGLTFKRDDQLDEMFNKFAVMPDDKVKNGSQNDDQDHKNQPKISKKTD